MALKITYTDYDDADLTKEVLTNDEDFLKDASNFLAKREGKTPETAEEIYDEYMEHMRFHEANEVTAVRDLMYAQEANSEDKLEFGRLIDTFDRMKGDSFTDAAGDYIMAGLTSPSTWLGLVTGGFGKMGAVATAQAAKTGVRAIIGGAAKKFAQAPDVVKGAVVEGAIGLGAGAAQEGARVETGVQEEFTGGRTLTTGIAQGIAGALPAGLYGLQQGRAAKKALKLRETGAKATAEADEAAAENVVKTLNKVKDKKQIEKTKEDILGETVSEAKAKLDDMRLNPLDKEKVKAGTKILEGMSGAERTLASLSDEVVDKITAASIELGNKINRKPGERIGESVARAMEDGRLKGEDFDKILSDFNLSRSEFATVYLADLSRAGRKLGKASSAKRALFGQTSAQKAATETAEKDLDKLIDAISGYMNQVGGTFTREEAMRIADDAAATVKPKSFFRDLDRLRLSMMTGQLATTVRNVAGGGFRVAMDVFDTSFKNMLKLGKDYDDPLLISKYLLFDQAEAKVVRELFMSNRPADADKFFGTFLETATASAKMGGDSLMTKTGATINTLNRVSDNMYKQAVFAGRLDQVVRRTMQKTVDGKQVERSLADVIADGDFKKIPDDVFKDAIEQSLEFVYQATPKGQNAAADIGRGLIKYHQKLPFLVSAFMPFPRFVINQLDFVNSHMPVFGLIGNKIQKKDMLSADVWSKQLTGLGMLSAAYDLRSRQGADTEWYMYRTEDGKDINLMPIAGPFNAFLLAADAIYRYKNGKEMKTMTEQAKAAFQALGGPSFRAGTGLYTIDRLVEDTMSEGEIGVKAEKALGRTIGDILNTFTLPAATVRDLVSLSDEQMRYLPQTGYTDFFDIVAAHATKSLPSIPGMPEVSLSEYISETLGTGAVDAQDSSMDMITGRARMVVDPLEKQLFGTGKTAPMNPLQKKLTELQMTPYELYKPSDYPYEDRLMREMGAKKLSRRLNAFVKTDKRFLKAPPETQKLMLINEAKEELLNIGKEVKKRIDSEQAKASQTGRETEFDRVRFERLGLRVREALRAEYELAYPGEEFNASKAIALLPKVKDKAKSGRAKGGYVGKYALGGLLRGADDVAEAGAKKSDDVDLDDMTDEEMDALLGYDVYDSGDDAPFFDKKTLDNLETAGEIALETVIGFTPIVGDVYDAYNVADNLRQAKYVDAAIDAIGFVPFIGNALSKGVKVTVDMFKNSDPVIKKRALGEFVRKEGRLPDLQDADDVENIVRQGAKQEKIVAGMATSDVDMPLFHGDTSLRGDSLEPNKITDPNKHAELKINAMSTSRDPVMSVDQFASRSGRQDPIDAMYTVQPKRGIMAKQDLRPDQYDRLSSPDPTVEIPTGAVESGLPTQLPKSRHVEAETMITDLDTVDIKKLSDQPELAEKVRKGIKTLEETRDLVAEAMDIGTEMVSKKEAMEFYSKIAKAMKKAQGLGAFTSGAGARGAYDQHLITLAIEGSDPRRGFDYLGLPNQIEEAARLLEGTQKGKMLDELLEGLFETSNAMFGFPNATDVAKEYTEAKKKIFDVTQRMNRGGLASRRT